MRKHLTWTLALAVAIAIGIAGLALAANVGKDKPVTIRIGNTVATADGGVLPKALPRRKMVPITFYAKGKIADVNGGHPPALQEVILDTDKNAMIDVKGYPTCKSGQLQARDTATAKKVCGPAIIGEGTTDVEVLLPEQAPIPAHSRLLVLNGGVKGGVTTLFIHAYITQPTPAAIVTTVKIKKEHKGRYGLKSVASIPLIVNGAGSVKAFNLKIHKIFRYKGKKKSVLTARCADGHFSAEVEAVFRNGDRGQGTVIRTCKPKG